MRQRRWMVGCLAALLTMGAANAMGAEQSETWVGSWRLVTPEKEPFFLRLKPDQSAVATGYDGQRLGDEFQGTWREEDGRAVIRYHSGWVDILLRSGERATQLSYEPGRPLDGRPSCLTPVFRLSMLDLASEEPTTSGNLAVRGNTYVLRDTASR